MAAQPKSEGGEDLAQHNLIGRDALIGGDLFGECPCCGRIRITGEPRELALESRGDAWRWSPGIFVEVQVDRLFRARIGQSSLRARNESSGHGKAGPSQQRAAGECKRQFVLFLSKVMKRDDCSTLRRRVPLRFNS